MPCLCTLNRERETPRKDYCNAVKRSVTVPVSPQVSSSNVLKCRHQILMLIVQAM